MPRVSYAATFTRAFEKAFDGSSETVRLTLVSLRECAAEIADDLGLSSDERARAIANVPDVVYNMRSRADSFPEEVAQHGFTTLEIIGRGVYRLTKEVNDIGLPEEIEMRVVDTSDVPKVVMDTTGTDEQAMLNMLCHTGIYDDFLDARCYSIQGHMRSSGTGGQQIEADFVVGCEREDESFLAAIEGKGVPEKVGFSQIKPTVAAVKKKNPDYNVVALAAKMEADYSVLMMEFGYKLGAEDSVEDIWLDRIVRYVLDPKPNRWG